MENTNSVTPAEKKGNIEDLVAWQKAKELATVAYKLINSSNSDDVLKDKMIDSVLEVSYSIARSYGVKQRIQSLENLYQAREAIFEFKTAFSIAIDLGMISSESTIDIQPLIDHTDKLVSGLIQYKEDARKGKVRKPIDYASSPVSNF
jgi:four helix bundle protein